MHEHLQRDLVAALDRRDRRLVTAGQQRQDPVEQLALDAQQEQSRLLELDRPVEPPQQEVGDLLPPVVELVPGAGDDGLAVQDRRDGGELVGAQRAAGGDEVADHVGLAQARGDLDRAVEHDRLGVDAVLGEPPAQGVRVGRGDAEPGELLGPGPLLVLGDRDVQPAGAPAELSPLGQLDAATLGLTGQSVLDQHVASDDPEVADAVGDEAGDVVVPDEQQVDRQALAVAEELVAALAPGEAAGGQQLAGRLAEAAGLLDRHAQAVARLDRRGHRDLSVQRVGSASRPGSSVVGAGRRAQRGPSGASDRR
ncbi:hypothetical protein BJF86_08055 [Serinicoccus sp. CNJ-927]|nr:hypothetical protein BJF86_08055 [Serinicoccus sp. CNJ-927]